jgi:hypothetical protein
MKEIRWIALDQPNKNQDLSSRLPCELHHHQERGSARRGVGFSLDACLLVLML